MAIAITWEQENGLRTVVLSSTASEMAWFPERDISMRKPVVSQPIEGCEQKVDTSSVGSRHSGNRSVGRLYASLMGALQALYVYRMRSFMTASGPFFGTVVATVAMIGIASVQALSNESRSIRLVILLCGCCAVLALLVGSFLCTRSMLAGVIERASEMSMRRGVGARGSDIGYQVMMEVLLLSGLGTAVGLVPGLLVGAGMIVLLQLPPVVNPILILGVCCGSLVAAGSGGIYPALRAARMEPWKRGVRASAGSNSLSDPWR